MCSIDGKSAHVTCFPGCMRVPFAEGKWLKCDCTSGDSTSSSTSFDSRWHSGRQVLYVYVKTDLLVADGTGDPSEDSSRGGNSHRNAAYLRASLGELGATLFRLELFMVE